MARIQTSGNGGGSVQVGGNIDGGSANRKYLVPQDLYGGAANTTSFTAVLIGGNATSTYTLG